MATSSITHNFVVDKKESVTKFVKALDKSKIKKSKVDAIYISSEKDIKHLFDNIVK